MLLPSSRSEESCTQSMHWLIPKKGQCYKGGGNGRTLQGVALMSLEGQGCCAEGIQPLAFIAS